MQRAGLQWETIIEIECLFDACTPQYTCVPYVCVHMDLNVYVTQRSDSHGNMIEPLGRASATASSGSC